ncbi:hypothetical protein BTJ68_07849 [Hortaea werneckii EXF-2000]|uniref:Uncharacterized protein n=1 Tax=Hortaea werneckii EXF-2000 TaxID=1157616 RepID=A0A1Z5T870_HORWE|nr:hypothetical protein BTJ68_07849 [Hortaea werneckii EXF-2000]
MPYAAAVEEVYMLTSFTQPCSVLANIAFSIQLRVSVSLSTKHHRATIHTIAANVWLPIVYNIDVDRPGHNVTDLDHSFFCDFFTN